MATMTHRTTFSLDVATMGRLKKLAGCWQVSQAEVVRRALLKAENRSHVQQPVLLARVKRYHATATFDVFRANAYLAQVRTDRKRWRPSSP